MTAASRPPAPENPSEPTGSLEEPRTRIIRRAPTGPLPAISDSAATQISRHPAASDATGRVPSPWTAVAAAAVSIVSGWATTVVATDLIAGWWRTDRLFCIAVGFLALVFAAATVTGVIMLLLRRSLGRYLIAAGAVVAVLTYGGVFIAGARVGWIVHTLPLLPIASAVLALHPATKRWLVE